MSDSNVSAKAGGFDLPRRQHDMGVMIANVGRAMRCVDGKIHRDPVAICEALAELAGKL